MESGSSTLFTSNADAWGTLGFMPPEYRQGGFKNADASGDVFMLGKSFYVLLTERDPLYLTADNIHPAIFHVIEHCCHIDKSRRYQRLSDLQQAISSAYDVILNRVEGFTLATRMLGDITERLKTEHTYSEREVGEFLDTLFLLDTKEQETLCKSLTPRLFRILGEDAFVSRLEDLLPIYDRLVRKNEYGWTFADTVAESAKAVISIGKASPKAAAQILDSALHATITQNQFSAMILGET